MDALYNLVQSLSSAQKKMVGHYLIAFSNKTDCKTQARELFNLLKNDLNGDLSEKDYSKKLLGQINLPKLYTIKSRLKSKILEAITSDQNLDIQDRLDQLDEMSIRLRKRMLQIRTIYWTQGNLIIINELLSEVILNATAFELYDILYDALNFKKSLIGLRKGNEVYQDFLKEVDFAEFCLKSIYKANRLYSSCIIEKKFNAGQPLNVKLKYLESVIAELRSLVKSTNSKSVQYFLNWLETEYFELTENYTEARNKVIEQLNNLKANKAIYRKSRIGFCYSNLSSNEIFLGDYKSAYKNSIKAQSFMLVNSFNYLQCENTKFYASFYDRNINNAEASLIILRHHMKEDQGSFYSAMYEYFQANIHFIKAEFSKALKLTTQNLEISKDKAGWDIALRIFSIMCMVELKNEDLAYNAVEALRKHVQRVNKVNLLTKRNILIVKIIQLLAKNGFAFESLTAQDLTGFHELSVNSTEMSWQPFTPEIIPFHEWVNVKLRKIDRKRKEIIQQKTLYS